MPELVTDFNEAKQNCRLAAFWTADYENRKVPEFNDRITQAQAWLEANKDNDSIWATMQRRQFQFIVDREPELRAAMEAGWQERLARYQEQDRICNIKKGINPDA